MTGSADCRDIRHALGVYVLGAIDPAERSMVDAHLSTCPECREELAGLASLPALLRRIPVGEAQQLADDDLDELPDAGLPEAEVPSEEMLDSLLGPHDARLARPAAGAAWPPPRRWSSWPGSAGQPGGAPCITPRSRRQLSGARQLHLGVRDQPGHPRGRDRPVRGQGLGHGAGYAGEERSGRGPVPAPGHRLQRAHHGRRRLDDQLRRGAPSGTPARRGSRWTACAASRSSSQGKVLVRVPAH